MDRTALVTLARGLERFLLPNACVSCDRSVGHRSVDALVCSVCLARLQRIVGGCPRCRQPLPIIGPCRACVDWPKALRTVTSAVWMTDESRAMIHHLKYEGLWRLADDLSQLMTQCLGTPPPGMLVPIPLGDRRLRTRGYNQAGALAEGLAARWRRAVCPGLLRRARETRSQTTMSASERALNVAEVFRARPPRDTDCPPVILVDDVFTTGATLASAAGALERVGWTDIHAVTFARAMPYEVSVGQ